MITFPAILQGVRKQSVEAIPVIKQLDRPEFLGFAAVLKGESSAIADATLASFARDSSSATRWRTDLRLW